MMTDKYKCAHHLTLFKPSTVPPTHGLLSLWHTEYTN